VTGTGIEHAVSDVTDVLLAPVLILALLCLALSVVEAGRVLAELLARRGRSIARIDRAVVAVRAALAAGDTGRAVELTRGSTAGGRMADTAEALLGARGPVGESRRAKLLADFDYGSLRSLERTRVLVRAGPALGLMGTLIPLSPALQALSRGDVSTLATDLRVAFSVTVLGLLIGAIAFAVSLVRDRIYGQDLSDLEYLSDGLTAAPAPAGSS
jgi:biopolymer transport protein ExbB/TolQ